jgi:hypothetical protein
MDVTALFGLQEETVRLSVVATLMGGLKLYQNQLSSLR